MIDQHTVAAIIGFWRSGATIEQIIGVTLLDHWQVQDVINSYQKTIIE